MYSARESKLGRQQPFYVLLLTIVFVVLATTAILVATPIVERVYASHAMRLPFVTNLLLDFGNSPMLAALPLVVFFVLVFRFAKDESDRSRIILCSALAYCFFLLAFGAEFLLLPFVTQ